ncbi:keratinocyte-associated protein 3 isoform X4 [Cynocephalus volans]|uniref:keratinocyte-associated protein 3 isoform X4 n=1 Tax=Cynocephalus volans TaxID=110931 RepID=UPI002FCC7340
MRCRRFTFGNFRPLPSFPCNHTRPTDAPGQPHQSGPPHPLRRLRPTRPPCFADAARGPRRLMRAGLALILLGHLNLLLGAVLHGTVLRHVANPRGAVTSEYTTANVISVGSGLLSVSVGLVALLASRNLLHPPLDCWILGYRWTRILDILTATLTPQESMIQPWLSGSLLCSCLQWRLLYLVTAVWLHSPYVELGPAGRKGFRDS